MGMFSRKKNPNLSAQFDAPEPAQHGYLKNRPAYSPEYMAKAEAFNTKMRAKPASTAKGNRAPGVVGHYYE